MPGTGTVAIMIPQGEVTEGLVWDARFATTLNEIMTGLKNDELPADCCMFFDVGYDFDDISIDMVDVRQPLDVIFVSSGMEVVGIARNAQPDQSFTWEGSEPARYFMEVNAGEAVGVDIGYDVAVTGLTSGQTSLIGNMITMMIVVGMMGMMMKMISEVK